LIGVGRCNNNTPLICFDSSKYVFWDAIHPSDTRFAIYRDLASLF
jgi:phospholipase/lecithinase/hemolysin